MVPGVVEKIRPKYHRYKVRYIDPADSQTQEKWFSVKDVTSCTRHIHGEHPQTTKPRKTTSSKISHRKNTRHDRFQELCYVIQHNPPGDGNCQFAALADQLQELAIRRSPAVLRDENVQDLRNNPFGISGQHFESYVSDMDWEQYLSAMTLTQTFGDHITLQRASDRFNVNILVFSSIGPQATVLISRTGFFSR